MPVPFPEFMELTGRSLGHYQVAEEISRGGMGIVYRATDTRLNRDVALKVLPQEVTHDDDVRRRFQKEAQAASALEHPHIAVIHGADEVDGVAYIAMEPAVADTSISFAIPKSMILAWPSSVTIRFAGFRSRWTMPFSCARATRAHRRSAA
jgi:hypothetical protein